MHFFRLHLFDVINAQIEAKSSWYLSSNAVSLTKTDKKTREQKIELVEKIQQSCNNFPFLYLIKVDNMRNATFKNIAAQSPGKFFFGKNRGFIDFFNNLVMAKALGESEGDEYKQNIRLLSASLRGNVGLYFSEQNPEEVFKFFKESAQADYARGGGIATSSYSLPKGPLMFGETPVPHNMEPQLRKLGLPTELIKGIVHLRSDHQVCKEGDILTPEQAQILVFHCY